MSEGMSPGPGFEQVDADAVCEACGTVNDESTLLCKQCGNNLRDQRTRRIAAGGVEDMTVAQKANHTRILTGIFTVLGILFVIYVVANIGNIEQGMVDYFKQDSYQADAAIGSSRSEQILDDLTERLNSYQPAVVEMRGALENPIIDSAYTGRYIILPPGPLTADRVIGEAELDSRGERVYFVARTHDGRFEIRGFAQMEEVEGARTPVSRDTAQVIGPGGITFGRGLAIANGGGGHTCIVSMGDEPEKQFLAFRLR